MYKKTGKDVAFDKERNKLKSEIFKLNTQIAEKEAAISSLKNELQKIRTECEIYKQMAEKYSHLDGVQIKEDFERAKRLTELLSFIKGGLY